MSKNKATYKKWVSETLDGRVTQQIERLRNAKDVRHVRIMPDVHLANDVCIGCVIATRELIYPAAIGSDIGCGMLAMEFDAPASLIRHEEAFEILKKFGSRIPIMKHQKELNDRSNEDGLSTSQLNILANRDGKYQLGTLGRGNHFLELQEDNETGRLWVMIHTGSRSMGPAIRKHYECIGNSKSGGMRYIEANSEEGQFFIQDLNWARSYAQRKRRRILGEVQEVIKELLGALPLRDTLIDCDHNHVQKEDHGGETLWIHRKGASSAHLDMPAIIPGSMGAPSFHVKGLGSNDSLCSSSHGAGRCMSREEARHRVSKHRLEKEMAGTYFDGSRVNGLLEEAPSAYKDVLKVMKAQRKLVVIKRKLMPLLSYKG